MKNCLCDEICVSNGATRGKKHLGGQSGILDKMYSSCI